MFPRGSKRRAGDRREQAFELLDFAFLIRHIFDHSLQSIAPETYSYQPRSSSEKFLNHGLLDGARLLPPLLHRRQSVSVSGSTSTMVGIVGAIQITGDLIHAHPHPVLAGRW